MKTSIRVTSNGPINGTIKISGAKNAALTLMPCALLTDQPFTLTNVPNLVDITTMSNLINDFGAYIETRVLTNIDTNNRSLVFDTSRLDNFKASYELVRKMRASILVLGPLVARFGRAEVSLPGGCNIGVRPVDLHLQPLAKMGAQIEIHNGYITATAPNGLHGTHFTFPFVTVGGTENILMAATLAKGTTVLSNAALEPEITNLAECLITMGAKIEGIGTDTLTIHGRDSLHGGTHKVLADRIETATYAMAAAITGGTVDLLNTDIKLIGSVVDTLKEAGVGIEPLENGFRVIGPEHINATDVVTQPYPGFPTDVQAQFTALMSVARGNSMITETVFENRFMHVAELARMDADIRVHGSSAIVRGVKKLSGASVMATDLRASASLIIAALVAEGTTTIRRVYHLDRGYERLEQKLSNCGAMVERIKEDFEY